MNGTVRLVQICVNGVWGHVCGYDWYTSNARVVCRQLGYSTTGKTMFSYRYRVLGVDVQIHPNLFAILQYTAEAMDYFLENNCSQ